MTSVKIFPKTGRDKEIIARDECNREIVDSHYGAIFSRDHEKLVNKTLARNKWITDVQIAGMTRKREKLYREIVRENVSIPIIL